MNKQELIRTVADKSGLRVTDAARAVNAFGEILESCMAAGEKITWPGVGSFFTREQGARQGRNPRTGAVFTIPARKVVRFTPGKALREAAGKR